MHKQSIDDELKYLRSKVIQLQKKKSQQWFQWHTIEYKAKIALEMMMDFLALQNKDKEQQDVINTTKITLFQFQAFIGDKLKNERIDI